MANSAVTRTTRKTKSPQITVSLDGATVKAEYWEDARNPNKLLHTGLRALAMVAQQSDDPMAICRAAEFLVEYATAKLRYYDERKRAAAHLPMRAISAPPTAERAQLLDELRGIYAKAGVPVIDAEPVKE